MKTGLKTLQVTLVLSPSIQGIPKLWNPLRNFLTNNYRRSTNSFVDKIPKYDLPTTLSSKVA